MSANIPGHLLATSRLHAKSRRIHFVEGKFNRAIFLFHEDSFEIPIRPNGFMVELFHYAVDFRRDLKQIVTPDRQQSVRFQDSFRFGKEGVAIEPVQRLRDRDQIEGSFALEIALFRGGDAIDNAFVSGCAFAIWLSLASVAITRSKNSASARPQPVQLPVAQSQAASRFGDNFSEE